MSDAELLPLVLFAGTTKDGRESFETVYAFPLLDDLYEIEHSPGLVTNIAAGDVIRLSDDKQGRFAIVMRGGNVNVQCYIAEPIEEIDSVATPLVTEIGGWLDGRQDLGSYGGLVYTIPVEAGFRRIEEIFERLQRRFESFTWMYGNVYDPKDGCTPLYWWSSEPPQTQNGLYSSVRGWITRVTRLFAQRR